MGKIGLIISREYITRIKKPSFIIMTILGPVLMACVFIIPVWLAMREHPSHKIEVIDDSFITDSHKMPKADYVTYDYPRVSIDKALKEFNASDYTIILHIPVTILGKPDAEIFFKKEPGMIMNERLKSSLASIRIKVLEDSLHINGRAIDSLSRGNNVTMLTKKVDENGNVVVTSTEAASVIGFASAIIMYMFIILYGVQVMRGVMEEKTNRIVEVIISSVKPFQLMMGKIVGVAMVGLTQFILWIVLTFALTTLGSATIFKNMQADNIPNVQHDQSKMLKQGMNVTNYEAQSSEAKFQDDALPNIYKGLMSLDYIFIIGCFLFYFLGGYLLYSALFAAVGSAIDAETDSQQFMLPITIPLIFSIVVMQSVMSNPDGGLAQFLSIFPLTSPVIMMVRVPFVNPGWELVISMITLILGFIFTTWLAGKIYRTGILMYGKKVSWRELGKWLFY